MNVKKSFVFAKMFCNFTLKYLNVKKRFVFLKIFFTCFLNFLNIWMYKYKAFSWVKNVLHSNNSMYKYKTFCTWHSNVWMCGKTCTGTFPSLNVWQSFLLVHWNGLYLYIQMFDCGKKMYFKMFERVEKLCNCEMFWTFENVLYL